MAMTATANVDEKMAEMKDKAAYQSTEGSRSIKITKKMRRSGFMFTMQHLIKPWKSLTVEIGKPQPAGSVKLTAPAKAVKNIQVKERTVEDIHLYELHPEEKKSSAGKSRRRLTHARLYYFAGGGWQNPPSIDHWRLCATLARNLPDITVSIVSYPLAPESPAPHAFPALLRLYRTLLRDATEAKEPVILAGDSAGGNVILAVTLAALKEDAETTSDDPTLPPCPSSILAISPSTDLRRQNPDMLEVGKHDPILSIAFVKKTANAWCGEWDAGDPRVSPLFADVTPLAARGINVHGVTGTYDILAPDAVLFREKCNEAGVKGEWLDWHGQMHCFPLAFTYKLPESNEALEWILDLLTRTP